MEVADFLRTFHAPLQPAYHVEDDVVNKFMVNKKVEEFLRDFHTPIVAA